jgi:lipoyl(octanoyl) transferase
MCYGKPMKTALKTVQWKTSEALVDYGEACAFMDQRVAEIFKGKAPETVWFLEHPPLYTAGTSAHDQDLIDPRFPVYGSGRGGEYTYHGPGQRVAYVMLDLRDRGQDVRGFVRNLEEWIILSLAEFGITGERKPGRVGVWVTHADGREEKIAALGVRVRKWITFHGISLNVDPDLSHYSGIVPCGISEHGVTSLRALGVDASMTEVDEVLKTVFENFFVV